jgi:hypothetical protein
MGNIYHARVLGVDLVILKFTLKDGVIEEHATCSLH